jgi:PPP family 3-phenylpropionic acid transporter
MSVPYWRLSGFYFFYFATLGAYLPYWNLYLKDIGFSSIDIGQISALLIATRIVGPNLWGWLSDRTGKNLAIIRVTLFFGVAVSVGFLFVHGFWWLCLITFGFGFFWNAALPQFEVITLGHLKDEPHRYSRIRLWGSVGFIATVLVMGWVLDSQPVSILPAVITALLAANWLVTLAMPKTKPQNRGLMQAGIMEILKKTEVLAFLFVNMLLQAAHGPYYVFYSLYLKELHYSAILTGSLWALGVFAEIILFIKMRSLLTRYSLRAILLLSLLLATVRWLLIGWGADNPGLLGCAQILHAASFGAAHVASIHWVHQSFGPEHQGKGQALYSSLSFGLGGMVGSLYSGYYWESLGSRFVYTLAALLCYLGFVIAYFWIRQEKEQKDSALG